jgi:hypothetical protein
MRMPDVPPWLDTATIWGQRVAAILLVLILAWSYSGFWKSLYRFVVRYLGLLLVLVLLYALVYAQLGTALGLPYLFWHEDFRTRVSASMGSTLLLGLIGIIAFYLDPYPWSTEQMTADWLRVDEHFRQEVSAWWSRLARAVTGHRPPRPPPEPQDAPTSIRSAPTWVDLLKFCANVVLDPISISPLQGWVEPRQENQLRLQRFLRTCRTPFLLLLLAPAVLPGVFTEVPRIAPTGGLWTRWRPHDVSRLLQDPGAYLLGIAAWLLGIELGVLVIKGLIRLSEVTNVFFAPSAVVPVAGQPEWVRADSACPLFAAGGCPGAGCPRGVARSGESAPQGCRAWWIHLRGILVFIGVFLATYVAMGTIRPIYDNVVSPAFAICALLGILAMAYALVAFLPKRAHVPVVVLLVAWLGFANHGAYKNRFENMAYDKAKLVDLRRRVDEVYFLAPEGEPGDTRLVPDHEALENWSKVRTPADRDLVEDRPKLVLVAVSGGAARSAYWTAVVLDRLERAMPEFGRRVRVISGASGGMLGTACYVKYRSDVARGRARERQGAAEPVGTTPARPSDWVGRVPSNSMDPMARFITLVEVWKALWPGQLEEDRGVVLERDWVDLRFPLARLADLERKGQVPSLIFSPMIVEDGRQLLISNLDLDRGATAGGDGADGGDTTASMVKTLDRSVSYNNLGVDLDDVSLPGLEFYRLFPESNSLLLSTAVRMNATFPYVSPAVNLPTSPPRRVVDAGYYDNYGIQVAVAWVRKNLDWLTRNTSGVLLVQVRDSSGVKDRLDVDDSPPTPWAWTMRGFQFLTSPIDGVLQARYTVSSFRNDLDVERTNKVFAQALKDRAIEPRNFFTTVIFENSSDVTIEDEDFWDELTTLDESNCRDVRAAGVSGGGDSPESRHPHDAVREVAMSWYLTRAERLATRRAIPDDPRPNSPWADASKRECLRTLLAGQVFETMSESELDLRSRDEGEKALRANGQLATTPPAQMGRRLRDEGLRELRRQGKLCYPPGPERDIRFKRLEQLRNYERVVNLKQWWAQAGRRAPGNPPAGR